MGLIGGLLTLPALGPARLVAYLARTVTDEADRQLLNEEPVRGELLTIQERFEAGELSEVEFERSEDLLLRRLDQIREIKEQRAG
jgi:hypothetical protein